MNTRFFLFCMALGAGSFLFSCKKSSRSSTPQWSAGTGQYYVGGITYATADTLAPDPITGLKDLTMWPTGTTAHTQTQLFIYNMPTATSGTVQLTDDPGGLNDTTCYILGNFEDSNGREFFSSNGVTGTLTKTGSTSFSFRATAYIGSNISDTILIQGNGTW